MTTLEIILIIIIALIVNIYIITFVISAKNYHEQIDNLKERIGCVSDSMHSMRSKIIRDVFNLNSTANIEFKNLKKRVNSLEELVDEFEKNLNLTDETMGEYHAYVSKKYNQLDAELIKNNKGLMDLAMSVRKAHKYIAELVALLNSMQQNKKKETKVK